MSATRNIGILTSGGDAPGMNAVIRAFVRRATSNNTNNNMKVFGFNRGYIGLRAGDITEMTVRSVSDILHRGGTVLRTSRDPEFKTQAGLEMAVKTCEKHNIDTVVIIGGNGSLYGARDLSNMGINCIFVPATIDNDIGYTDYSIGFDTALNTGVTMIDKLRDTASSHEKCNLVEVMGKKCGNLALHIGIATGATSILVPEKSYDFQKDIINRIKFTQKIGKEHFIIIIAEGCENIIEISKKIEQDTNIHTRCTILGHVQRGGSPSARDRIIASTMGYRAAELLINNQKNKSIFIKNNIISDINIQESIKISKKFDFDLLNQALNISI